MNIQQKMDKLKILFLIQIISKEVKSNKIIQKSSN